jgi:hypothetical protein
LKRFDRKLAKRHLLNGRYTPPTRRPRAIFEERLGAIDDKVIQAVKNEENAAGRVAAISANGPIWASSPTRWASATAF